MLEHSLGLLVEFPLPVVKGTHLSGLEPAGDAVEVEGVVTHSPCHRALLTGGRGLVGLALDTCSNGQCSTVRHTPQGLDTGLVNTPSMPITSQSLVRHTHPACYLSLVRHTPTYHWSDTHPPITGQTHTHLSLVRHTPTYHWSDTHPPITGQTHTHLSLVLPITGPPISSTPTHLSLVRHTHTPITGPLITG